MPDALFKMRFCYIFRKKPHKPTFKTIQLTPANNTCGCGTGDSKRKLGKLPENYSAFARKQRVEVSGLA
jgi:hypothetical protein